MDKWAIYDDSNSNWEGVDDDYYLSECEIVYTYKYV